MNADKTCPDSLSWKVLGAVFEVSNTLGAGFLENGYQRALLRELSFFFFFFLKKKKKNFFFFFFSAHPAGPCAYSSISRGRKSSGSESLSALPIRLRHEGLKKPGLGVRLSRSGSLACRRDLSRGR